MPLFQKKPAQVRAITFNQLVAHGVAQGAPLTNGMPWAFTYEGLTVTHEDDNCYLVASGTVRFERGDMLVTEAPGVVYAVKPDVFEKTFHRAPCSSLDQDCERSREPKDYCEACR
jgi:hypothetical protein